MEMLFLSAAFLNAGLFFLLPAFVFQLSILASHSCTAYQY